MPGMCGRKNDTPEMKDRGRAFAPEAYVLRRFRTQDQEAVKKLILEGLEDHWGFLNSSLNPDLENISESYASAYFLVAAMADQIVACGALLPLGNACTQIVRMSVKRDMRGMGLGSRLLESLIVYARETGLREIILETTAAWKEVIAFYQAHGFQFSHELDGDVYLRLLL